MSVASQRRRLRQRDTVPKQRPGVRITPEILAHFRKDFESKKLGKMDRVRLTDNIQSGMRVIINKSGLITFYANYTMRTKDGNERPYFTIGHYPEEFELKRNPRLGDEFIADMRDVATIIRNLADMGIDVQAGLHERIVAEIRAERESWTPEPRIREKKIKKRA